MSPQRERAAEREIRQDPRAGDPRRRQQFEGDWPGRASGRTVRCWKCGAADARDRDHQHGCPRLPAVSKERMLEIAIAAQAGWGF